MKCLHTTEIIVGFDLLLWWTLHNIGWRRLICDLLYTTLRTKSPKVDSVYTFTHSVMGGYAEERGS